jgi:hypothetical protein
MRLVAAAIAVAIGAALLAYGGTPPVRAAASCPVSQVRYDAYGGGDQSRDRPP